MVRVLRVRLTTGSGDKHGEVQDYITVGTTVFAVVLWDDFTLSSENITDLVVERMA
jgi:hypothetical protein